MLICENLSFSIDGHKLFSNININVENQKDLLITGPSGIGKTTLLSILCGLQKPSGGDVLYNDINLYNLAENKIDHFRGNNLGIVFQNFNLINSFTVKQNLELANTVLNGNPKWIFCDEPTSSLDDKNTENITTFIKEESLRCKASLILITHDKRVQSILNFSQTLKLGEEL